MSEIEQDFRILIVDDTPKNIQILGKILRDEGYQINVAQDGKQALNVLSKVDLDLILLDIMMPEMDGFETCQHLKSDPETQEIPVIFLTAKTEVEDIVKGFELGAVDYISKPFQIPELLARVRTHLQLRKEIQDRKRRELVILEELEQARKTQATLLPDELPNIPHMDIACRFVPMEEVGGDFYNLFELDDNKFGIMIADVTGHGISAAMLSFMISGFFMNNVNAGSPNTVLYKTNENLIGKLQDDKFATMFFGIYDANDQTITYSLAGHPPALVIRSQTGEAFQLRTMGPPVGIFPNDMITYEEKVFSLMSGDKLLIYTDGYTELVNPEGKMLGPLRFQKFLQANARLPIEELMDKIYEYGQNFLENGENNDDITLVGIEMK